jgi:hypothetical protein
MSDERLHHLTKDAGGWVMRVTVDRGPKLTGKPLRIRLGKCTEKQAIRQRDNYLRVLGQVGAVVKMRKMRKPVKKTSTSMKSADISSMPSPALSPRVGSEGVSGPIENIRIYLDIIPSEFGDIVRESFDHVTHGSGAVDDSVGYESLHHAILNAEDVGTRVLGDVVSENLFLVFGQTVKSLRDALMEFPLPQEALEPIHAPIPDGDQEQHYRRKEKHSQNRALILCKLLKSEDLLKLRAAEEDDSCHQSDRYQVTWGELQKLKERLKKIGHIS